MKKIRSFEEIVAWQKSRELNLSIYELTNSNKLFKDDFELNKQIRRSSISISSNIAEGFERMSTKEFIRFLYIAKASAGEVRSQLYLAFDLGYISSSQFKKLKMKASEVSKLISGFIKYLNSTL